ncbi:MAG: hypothetical protein J0H49_28435 [Acidobacteria bacterium]|nr:hypothetical protein [Acidobacteriota bacterium]
MTFKPLLMTLWVCLPFAVCAQSAYDVALIGDVPYGAATEPKYERMIADINKAGVELTVHIGDTKSGSTRCDDAHYGKTLNWFNSFDKPLMYSVGDNEWTDCLRANNGGYDPLDRLALIRKTYFSSNMSMGRNPVQLMVQSDDAQYALYSENRMLVKPPVVFATIHMPGSNNNYEYRTAQGAANPFYDNDKEYTARNAANLAWLHKAFQTARATKALGVMLLIQANVFESFMDTGTGSTHSGFADFVTALREETKNFPGEVVMVSGDSHYMRVDKPLTENWPACTTATGNCTPFEPALDARGNRILNFTRLEVPGSGDVHWAVAHIRPNSRNVFQFEFMILPATATATGVTAVATAQGTKVDTNTVETQSSQIVVDGSTSSSTNGGDLQYEWTPAPGYPVPAILGNGKAAPVVQFSGKGIYRLVLTVTDRTGASAQSTLTIRVV